MGPFAPKLLSGARSIQAGEVAVHCSEMLELAAVITTQGAVLIRGAPVLPETALQQYWSTSRSRLDRWGRALKAASGCAFQDGPAGLQWRVFRDVLAEILTAEVLTRAWTAIVCAHDRQHESEEAEPIVRSVHLGHLDTRRRVLNLLAHIARFDTAEAEAIDRLRARCDRWCDWLIGQLGTRHDVCQFAADPERAAEFARDLHDGRGKAQDAAAWRLMLVSLRAGFKDVLTDAAPNYDLNLAVGTSILGCFTPDLFDGVGALRSPEIDPLLHPPGDGPAKLRALLGDHPPLRQGLPDQDGGAARRWRLNP